MYRKGMIVIFSFISTVWNTVWPYLVAVLVLFSVIIIHEFGHFLFAKLNGIRVNEFAIGFGPKLIKKQIGETEYSLRLIPFGGLCAMEGEDENSADPRAFNSRPAWRRLLVVIAGALFNLILGFVLSVAIVAPQERFATTTVAKFDENAVSCDYGLDEGDKILQANGRRIYTVYDLSYVFGSDEDGYIDFVVERGDKEVTLDKVKFDLEELDDGNRYIRLDFYVVGEERTFGSVLKNSFNTVMSYGRIVFMSLTDLLTGKFGLNDMSGPVGITVAIGDAARQSLSSVINLACLITVNLGIFNLLPLPALDGGRVIFLLYEMVRRKPVPQKFEGIVHTVGFMLLLLLIVVISFKDIIGLFI